MADDPAELRLEAEDWLGKLRKRQMRLHRHLFLVPGITDEFANCWRWLDAWGQLAIDGWGDDTRTIVRFDQLGAHSAATFIDLGDYLRRKIIDVIGSAGSSTVPQFDVVCHSMGGLDSFAALVALSPGYDYSRLLLPRARYFITLDTPFRGVLNWRIRCGQKDISDPQFPDRPTQCAALSPQSPELSTMLANREALSELVDHVVCMQADREAPIEVDWASSDLWSDRPPDADWQTGPTYHSQMIPGTCHSGVGGITWSPITIAQVFNCLLFTPDAIPEEIADGRTAAVG